MNGKRFDKFMRIADDSLLEEAQRPVRSSRAVFTVGGLAAACLCIALVAILWRPWAANTEDEGPAESGDSIQLVNPVRGATEEELADLGYSMPLPEGAAEPVYTLIDTGESQPMAQATFTVEGSEYTCRALKADRSADISGIYADWTQSFKWNEGGLEMQLHDDGEKSWIGWYSSADGIQWCLSADREGIVLLATAGDIIDTLGYDLNVAPEGATDIAYATLNLGGLDIAEISFAFEGVGWVYRIAYTPDTSADFADISGLEGEWETTGEVELSWCNARLDFNEGGAGKLIWFDVAPGLLYSLTVESGASEEALTEMAGRLFVPAQDDVG